MLRMPLRVIALSFALALVVLIVTAPFDGVAQAGMPSDACMRMDNSGAAHFEPNELPDTVSRDFDGGCEWWKYERENGRYVRTYSPCRYGNASAEKAVNARAIYAKSVTGSALVLIAVESTPEEKAAEPMDADAQVGADEMSAEQAESDAADSAEASEGMGEEVAEDTSSEETGMAADQTAMTEEPDVDDVAAEETDVEATEAADSEAGGVAADDADAPDTIDDAAVSDAAGTGEVAAEPVVEVVQDIVKEADMDMPADILQTLAERNEFATILAAAGASELSAELSGEGPYTVFAPNDEAFAAALPGGDLDEYLFEASDQLRAIVLYHLVPGLYSSDTFTDGVTLTTKEGGELLITVEGDSIMVNDATIVAPDIEVSNGIVHVIDGILLPASE